MTFRSAVGPIRHVPFGVRLDRGHGNHAEAKEAYGQAKAEDPSNTEAARGYTDMVALLKGEGVQDQDAFARSIAQEEQRRVKAQRHFELGGYSTWPGTNYLEPRASEKIVDHLVEMAQELKLAAKQ